MTDASTHFHERGALITALMAGELDAAEAVARTRPAVELLGLLVPIDGLTERYLGGRARAGLDVTRHDFEPWRRQLLAVVAALLERWVGEDLDAWLTLTERAGTFRGSVTELVGSVAHPRHADRALWAGRAPRWPRGVDASAVFFAMAPPGIVEAFLDTCITNEASQGLLTRMLDRGPLHPTFVEYARGPLGTDAMAAALYRNPAYAIAQLRQRVLRDRTHMEVLEHAYFAVGADRELRMACVRLAEAAGGFRVRFGSRLASHDEDVSVLGPLLVSGDPQLVHWVLRRINNRVRVPAMRWAAYATLARTTGLESVWALEQERTGSLARMAGPVRESMATGSVEPILAVAEELPVRVGSASSEIELGAPLIEAGPYTDLIREHVVGDSRRERVVAELGGAGDVAQQRRLIPSASREPGP